MLNEHNSVFARSGPLYATGVAQDKESSPAKDRRSTAVPRNQLGCSLIIIIIVVEYLGSKSGFHDCTEQDSRRQQSVQTSLRRRCGIARLTICLLMLN